MKVHFIHWKPAEAVPRISTLERAGHTVAYVPPDNSGTLKHIRASGPDAILIDLTRSPSHGKAVGVEARRAGTLRHIPLVFVGGEADKVAAIKALLPDATYCEWPKVAAALTKAKRQTIATPAIPAGSFEQYANKPLAIKLGVKPDMKIALFHPPAGFDRAVADFPPDIEWKEDTARGCNMAFVFADSQANLDATFARIATLGIPIWVMWPKQASGQVTDITQHVARTVGHAYGLTDCKVCSFNATWSGFLFRMKRK